MDVQQLFDAARGSDGRRGSEHPSDLQIVRFNQSELDPAEADMIREHIDTCDSCQAFLQSQEAAFRAIGEAEQRRMVDAIHVGVVQGERDRPAARSRWSRLWSSGGVSGFVAVATFAAVAIVFTGAPDDGVRSKGALKLVVHRERGGVSSEVLSGASFQAGDRVRFEVELDGPGHAMVVGVEGDGRVYPCAPAVEGSALELAGGRQLLPDAIALDESTGRERLHLIACPFPFRFSDVIKAQRLSVPADCASTPFDLLKFAP